MLIPCYILIRNIAYMITGTSEGHFHARPELMNPFFPPACFCVVELRYHLQELT